MTNYIAKINNKEIGGDNFNSYIYINNSPILLSSGSLNSTSAITISLENLIPNDGYDYDIFLGADAYLESSGHYASFNVYPATITYANSNITDTIQFFQEYCRTSARYYSCASRWITVKSTDRNITILNYGGATYKYELYFYGIRRLTNNITSNCIANINNVKVGGDNFDGQFTSSVSVLSSGITMTTNQVDVYSLSSYLPNDGYDYMVDFGAYGRTASSASGYYHWWVGSGTLTASEIKDKAYLMMASEYHSTSTYCCSNNISIPIFATDKNVTFAVTDNSKTSGNCGFYALGYRRIGKNMSGYSYIPGEYLTYSPTSIVTFGIKYEDYLKIQKINTAGKYECDFYNLSSTPTVIPNTNLMVYTDAQEAQTAISNWSSNTSDFPPNEHTLITDLTSLNEIAVYYRVANNSFTQQGLIGATNATEGNAQIIEIGEL